MCLLVAYILATYSSLCDSMFVCLWSTKLLFASKILIKAYYVMTISDLPFTFSWSEARVLNNPRMI